MVNRILLVSLLAGCSGGETSPTSDVDLSLTVSIPAGAEIHRCQLHKLPAEETFVVAASHSYTPGSHHMLVYRTDLTDISADLEGVRDCYEGPSGGLMRHVRGVVYGSQAPAGEAVYPEGVGLPLAAGEVLLLQAHYLNAGTAPLTADVAVKLRTAPGDSIRERAGVLVYYDPFIHVPAGGTASATMSCRVPRAVTLLSASSHMHERGTGYAAYLDAPGARAAAPFYTTDSWDHPAGWSGPLSIAKDSVIRFECHYTNAEDRTFIQGQSAADNEMCMFIGVYYPAMTQLDEFCIHGPHVFGTGSASCGDTLACIRECPPGSAPAGSPGEFLASGRPVIGECWQRCVVASCPAAWEPLVTQLLCFQQNCAAACATPGSPACQSCVVAGCLDEILACSAATCET